MVSKLKKSMIYQACKNTYTDDSPTLGGVEVTGGLNTGCGLKGGGVVGAPIFCPNVGLVLCGAKLPQSTPG